MEKGSVINASQKNINTRLFASRFHNAGYNL